MGMANHFHRGLPRVGRQTGGPEREKASVRGVRDLFDLSEQVALVTGGSRGLGLEMAIGLGQAGARVAVTARRREWLDGAAEVLAREGVEHEALEADVSDPDSVHRLVEAVEAHFGPVDVLVNSAGVSLGAPALEMPLSEWRRVLDVNLTGTFLCCQAVGRGMVARGRGAIINVASVVGLYGSPPQVLDAVGYAASKGGVIALTRDLAVKWAPHGVRVNCIAPGFFPTRLSRGVLEKAEEAITRAVPMGRVGQEGELMGVAVFLASEAASYITGQVILVDGGMSAA